jgi:beta-RFAP synthase
MTRLRIRTASRLHFGLLGWGPQAARQFGGVGLMIESPGIEIVAEPARQWSFEGFLADRVRTIVEQFKERRCSSTEKQAEFAPAKLQVMTAPAEHVGLGVGTQLSLAVVRALLELAGPPAPAVDTLARLSGRGRRSGIGTHGFAHGGMIVDGGRRDEVGFPPLLARVAFPDEWVVLTVQLEAARGLHGHDEVQAFSTLPPLPERVADRLCRLVLLGLLPAVLERDLSAFGDALHELQLNVGSAFAPVQGGIYSSPQSESVIKELARSGLVGAGQSSWGPTLYAFGVLGEPERAWLISRLHERCGLSPSAMTWTRAANHGALLEQTGS